MDAATLPAEVSTLTIDHGGSQIPIYEHPVIKNTPDMPTAFKRLIDNDAEINRRVRIPAADAKPEDVQGFWKRITDGKVPVDAAFIRGAHGVPATAAEYEYTKPATLPAGLEWSDERLTAAKEWAHKAGLNKEQFKSAVELYQQIRTEELNVFKSNPEASMAQLKTEWGADFDKKWAMANAGTEKLLNNDASMLEIVKTSGLGTHPAFAKAMAEYGAATMEDSTHLGDVTQLSGLKGQLDAIMKPGGAKFDLFMKGDPTVLAERDALYAKLHPGMVNLT